MELLIVIVSSMNTMDFTICTCSDPERGIRAQEVF